MSNQISIKEQFAEAQRILDRIRAIHDEEDELQIIFFHFQSSPSFSPPEVLAVYFFAVYMPPAQGDVIKEEYQLNMTVKIGLFNLLQVWSGELLFSANFQKNL